MLVSDAHSEAAQVEQMHRGDEGEGAEMQGARLFLKRVGMMGAEPLPCADTGQEPRADLLGAGTSRVKEAAYSIFSG